MKGLINAPDDLASLGDHPALKLLNTIYRADGTLVDTLETDQDVVRWLIHVGWPLEGDAAPSKPLALRNAARSLREIVRVLLEQRKAGRRADLRPLNAFLAEAHSTLELSAVRNGSLRLERKWRRRTPHQSLGPIAESAAELLATGDLDLVKKCEDQQCVLWFFDRTKSHRRRWCSASTCGNRHKVAAFRDRQKQNS